MRREYFVKNLQLIILSGIIICLFLFKLSVLYLPHFWDDAWPYATGVHLMYEHGLSLLPGAIPFEVSRGHPLLFHFLFAGWMKIFGASLISIHFFSFLISVALLVTVYFFCAKYFGRETALWSFALLCTQAVFVAQSGLVLPEMMLALLGLLSMYFYLQRAFFLYFLFASLMLLTKESGVVLIVVLFIYELTGQLGLKNNVHSPLRKANRLLIVVLPILFASWFFILQKIKTGYFFLPIYTDSENFSAISVRGKLYDYAAYFFIYQGRNIASITILISLVWILFIRKAWIKPEHKKIISLMSILIVLFLVFSSCNFYSPRYLLFILPAFAIIVSFMLTQAFSSLKIVKVILGGAMLFASLTYCLRKYPVNDHSTSYFDAIQVSQETVLYCEQNNLFDRKIETSFLMQNYLSNKYCGYLSADKVFTNVKSGRNALPDFFIRCSFEKQNNFDALLIEYEPVLLMRFEKNYSWVEIYQVK